MSIQISTTDFENTHGRKPKGQGSWAFVLEASHGQPEELIFAPSYLTYTQACAWLRKRLRQQGWQDASVEVGS